MQIMQRQSVLRELLLLDGQIFPVWEEKQKWTVIIEPGNEAS